MPGSTRRGSYSVGVERRERILDAATTRFMDAGYGQTSLADIARDVGITTPGVTHHFPTKQHILLAIAERRFDLLSDLAEAQPHTPDGTGALRMMLALTTRLVAEPSLMELFVLVSAEAADPHSAAHGLFRERYERVVTQVVERFQEDVDAGLLRPDIDYVALARESIAVTDGLQLQWVLSGGAIDLTGMVRTYLERLAPSILITGAGVSLAD